MFLRLQIDHFAIIDHSSMEFHDGFSVLTGETGAGKSIIMDAMGLILGARAQKNMIRKDAEKASIQGVFVTKNKKALDFLAENNIPFEDVIIVERSLYRDRPSLSEINGKIVTNALLKEFGSIMALSGVQGENGFLMKPSFQLELLDRFCGEDQNKNLAKLSEVYAEYRAIEERLNKEVKDPQAMAREGDLLRYQIEEIETLALEEGEDEALAEEFRARNSHTETLALLQEMNQLAYEEGGIRSLLDRYGGALEKVTQNDNGFKDLFESFEDIRYGFQDLAQSLRDKGENFDDDPERLQEITERLDAINRLKRKYGDSYEKIQAFLEESRERLAFIDDYEQVTAAMKKELEAKKEQATALSHSLRKRRMDAARQLEGRMAREMEELDIHGAAFKVDFSEKSLSADGMDGICYLIATNKGEDLQPMADIASGGEISRIFLAFISIFAELDEREILILDEVDTGMSGKTAKVVAEKIKRLSKDRQLIVVSHLPQVVARADRQYRIQKREEAGRTISYVQKLNEEERIAMLATMISGEDTEKTRDTAREMLQNRI
ncbi:DNA repair protein RecN [Aedoeadaptatus pacaensis]|uniref:DNA repair protein RecN n=1 Tax=Aedoeadaptatus pacaensis TaxID=1776390 RepID=UPI0008380DC9|nr:DNA repair protein RecN [Peptoniphilus pacaensis]